MIAHISCFHVIARDMHARYQIDRRYCRCRLVQVYVSASSYDLFSCAHLPHENSVYHHFTHLLGSCFPSNSLSLPLICYSEFFMCSYLALNGYVKACLCQITSNFTPDARVSVRLSACIDPDFERGVSYLVVGCLLLFICGDLPSL